MGNLIEEIKQREGCTRLVHQIEKAMSLLNTFDRKSHWVCQIAGEMVIYVYRYNKQHMVTKTVKGFLYYPHKDNLLDYAILVCGWRFGPGTQPKQFDPITFKETDSMEQTIKKLYLLNKRITPNN